MILKSRNTMVTTAVLFLIVVVLLRLSGGFFEENITRIIGAIAGGKAEHIPLLDFGSIGKSWLNPATWSLDDLTAGINGWLHNLIDSVLPAVINVFNTAVVPVVATTTATRVKLLSVAAKTTTAVV